MFRISFCPVILLLLSQIVVAQTSTTEFVAPLNELNVFNAYRINSSGYEFSPSFYQKGIVYVAAQRENEERRKSQTPFFELYYAALDADGMPSQPKIFSTQVNTRQHEGQASFTKSEELVYYTGNSEVKNANGQYAMKIYEARKGEKDWEYVVDLPFNSESYSNRHPSISPDGNTLYFASNMPGGYGGTDLYVVKKEGSYWGIPKNLGERINTAENDAFPFCYKEQYLFFSSKGHGGKGDYDIFVVNIEGGLPGPILHLDTTFNSPNADIGFIVNEEGTNGFFSSDRSGGFGKDDIYLFESPKGFSQLLGKKEIPSELVVASDKSVEIEAPAPEKETVVATTNIPPKEEREQFQERNIPAELITPFQKKPITEAKKPVSCAAIKCAILDLTGNPIPNATVTIRSSCGGMPIEVLTDSKGLIESCLPLNCQYIIVGTKAGYMPMDRMFTVDRVSNYQQQLVLSPVPSTSTIPTAYLDDPLSVGSSIELQAIAYDLEQGIVPPSNASELIELARLMTKYPSIKIAIVEHTDARGSANYNYQLSQTRASIAKDYLVKNGGIHPARIQAIGMGEQQLRNHCFENTACTNEEHQYNRRTEIQIVKIASTVTVRFNRT